MVVLACGPPMSVEQFVCATCVNDPGLAAFVEENAGAESCDFCEREAAVAMAASVEDVGRFMERCLRQDYEEAVEALPHETAEGGFQGTTYDTWEIFD